MNAIKLWDNKVDEIKNSFEFKSEFDLGKHLIELIFIKPNRECFSTELQRRSDDFATIKRLLKKENETLGLLKKISGLLQVEFNLQNLIAEREVLIEKLSVWLNKQFILKPGKKYIRSEAFTYVGRLIGIYHEGTGYIPVLKRAQNYEEGFKDNFYNYLIECKKLLVALNLDLPEDETLGRYAYDILNGYIKNGERQLSYSERRDYFESGSFTQIDSITITEAV